MNLQFGSRGDDVKKLQDALIKQGYSLTADGIFGAQTQAAVRQYQSARGLAVDGIAGAKTQGSLYGTGGLREQTIPTAPATDTGSSGADTNAAAKTQSLAQLPGVSTRTAEALGKLEQGYAPSANVQAAQDYLAQVSGEKPGAFDSAGEAGAVYQQQLDDIYDKIMSREDFSYDVGGDLLYQQYRDRYMQGGQTAMQDTAAQAAALTGGYGSTYAQGAGQQAYDAYLQGLNDIVPELYDAAYGRYQDEGDRLLEAYQMAAGRQDDAYAKYRDTVSDWETERAWAQGDYWDKYNAEYGQYADDRAYYADKAARENAEYWTQKEWDAAQAAAAQRGSSSGGSYRGSDTSGIGKIPQDIFDRARTEYEDGGDAGLEDYMYALSYQGYDTAQIEAIIGYAMGGGDRLLTQTGGAVIGSATVADARAAWERGGDTALAAYVFGLQGLTAVERQSLMTQARR